MRTRTMLAALATIAATLAAPARADDDLQGWLAGVAQGTVGGDLYVWLEGQARITDDLGRDGQWILRPAIGAVVAPDTTALAGYAYVRTNPAGGVPSDEHRLWQQLQTPILRGTDGAPRLISRTRIEQRMIEGADRTGWRLRQLVRFQAPIAAQGRIQAVAYTEGFFNLNTTDFGARRGVDQWRSFVGIGLPLGERLRIEPGYLNQHVFRAGEDRSNHILNATLLLAL